MQLWCLRKDLLTIDKTHRSKKRLRNGDIESGQMDKDFHGGYKCHGMTHVVSNIQRNGADQRTIDTEDSECFHKLVVNEVFETTSKTVCNLEKEMLRNIAKKKHSKYLLHIVPVNNVDINTEAAIPYEHTPTTVIDKFGNSKFELDTENLVCVEKWFIGVQQRNLNNDGIVSNDGLHPIIDLTGLLAQICLWGNKGEEDEEDYKYRNDLLTSFMQGSLKLKLLYGLRFNETKEKEKFYIHAHKSYMLDGNSTTMRKPISVFSFVEVKCLEADGTDKNYYAQVLAILCYSSLKHRKRPKEKEKETTSTIHLLICYMEEVQTAANKSMLPFPRFKHNYVRDTPWTDIIMLDNIVV